MNDSEKEAEKGERQKRERVYKSYIYVKIQDLDYKAWILTKQSFIVMFWCNISYTLCWWTTNEFNVLYMFDCYFGILDTIEFWFLIVQFILK